MKPVFKFLYLNMYAFLLAAGGLAILLAPLYSITPLFLALQIPAAFFSFFLSVKLFCSWKDKLRLAGLLVKKNQKGFKSETFKEYMQAPCSRLVVKAALKELHWENRYGELLRYKPGLKEMMKANCSPAKTRIYINEEYLKSL
jgi:hypothetical protein